MQKIPHKKDIANKIRKGIRQGLNIQQIFGSIQHMQDAPGSIQTFYRIYRKDIDEERADIVGKVGEKVVDQALAGDFKSQELFLRSRGGWSPQSTVNEVEVEEADEDTSAINSLMQLLGKLEDTETETKE